MRIICLVPSISETLVACQVNLIGRSRFCIHPELAMKKIQKVGGTKDVDWEKVLQLKPDLVILDKEENTKEMADTCPVEYMALHITQISDVANELQRLATRINNLQLAKIAQRWRELTVKPMKPKSLHELPGVIQWWNKPDDQTNFEYLIWKDPWMAIGNQTFIQSVLDFCGFSQFRRKHLQKYPTIELTQLKPTDTLLLFSSEPFPFARHQSELSQLGYACALIDGELYSWYGIRSLSFLESLTSET